MQFSSIWPIDRTLSGATTPGQSGPGSNGNEGALRIPQSSSITGTSTSDCLVSYPRHSLGQRSYPSAEMQLVYSTAPANWAIRKEESSGNQFNNHWKKRKEIQIYLCTSVVQIVVPSNGQKGFCDLPSVLFGLVPFYFFYLHERVMNHKKIWFCLVYLFKGSSTL